jgi:hypothetical protein
MYDSILTLNPLRVAVNLRNFRSMLVLEDEDPSTTMGYLYSPWRTRRQICARPDALGYSGGKCAPSHNTEVIMGNVSLPILCMSPLPRNALVIKRTDHSELLDREA